jgi:hypothetical protein
VVLGWVAVLGGKRASFQSVNHVQPHQVKGRGGQGWPSVSINPRHLALCLAYHCRPTSNWGAAFVLVEQRLSLSYRESRATSCAFLIGIAERQEMIGPEICLKSFLLLHLHLLRLSPPALIPVRQRLVSYTCERIWIIKPKLRPTN